jgi:cytidylate kinase
LAGEFPEYSGGSVIAIDGPAASGKSTVALELARRLGFRLIDSGAMYRSVTLLALERGIAADDEKALESVALEVGGSYGTPGPGTAAPRVLLGDRDITDEIRSPAVGELVSPVSTVPAVRREMVRLQRALSEGTGAVVEGRDIGTTVFPDAGLKVFLEASKQERAMRRFKELRAKGLDVTLDGVEREIETRDRIDSSRDASPLAMAPDAVRIDTTDRTVAQVVEEIVGICEASASDRIPVKRRPEDP